VVDDQARGVVRTVTVAVSRSARTPAWAVPALVLMAVASVGFALRLRRNYAKTAAGCVFSEHASVLGPLVWGGLALAVVALVSAVLQPRRAWRIALAVLGVLVVGLLIPFVVVCGADG
jgi:hypothetical protein